MSDPTRALRQYLDSDDAPSRPAVVQSDLARGRRALRRRRVAFGGSGAVLVTAAAIALGLVATSSPRPPASVDGQPALVAWTGRQLRGFVVAQVPRGYVLQSVSATSVDISKPGDTSDPDIYVGKLVVVVVTAEPDTNAGKPVTVGGHRGKIRDVNGTRILTYTDGSHYVSVQAWRTIPLTVSQLIEFAEGVHITPQVHPLSG